MSGVLAPVLAGGVTAAVAAALTMAAGRRRRRRAQLALARACHELRGPLGAIGLIARLGSGAGALDRARVDALQGELRRAATALEDLEALRRGDPFAPALRLEQVAVADLVGELIQAVRSRLAGDGVELGCAAAGGGGRWEVLADRRRLAQALVNLAVNAAEHGAGRIELSWAVERGRLRVEVRDQGPGLPDAVPALVRRGRRGRGRRGHGLAIADGILRAHGGRLAGAPSERGARLVLELPAREAAQRLVAVAGRG